MYFSDNRTMYLFFQNRYSQELALMYLWQEDYDRARHYTNMAQEFFLQVCACTLIFSSLYHLSWCWTNNLFYWKLGLDISDFQINVKPYFQVE